MPTVYTVGHGARAADELLATLADAGITCVADVRRHPGSRRHPHFARAALEQWLPAAGVTYEWWGEELGGRRGSLGEESRHGALRVAAFRHFADHMDTPGFGRALEDLRARAVASPVAIMCAETLWWRCHRRLISDALVMGGAEVVHLLHPDRRQEHRLHESVRVDERGRLTYDGALPLG